MAIDEQENFVPDDNVGAIADLQAEKLRQSLLVTQRETVEQEPFDASSLPPVSVQGSAQAVNPTALVDTLMQVANSLDSARNQVAGGLQAQMTAAQVAQIQAKNQIKQQVNKAIAQPAEAMGKVVNQVEAQIAGNIADVGEPLFNKAAGGSEELKKAWLKNAGDGPQQKAFADRIVAFEKRGKWPKFQPVPGLRGDSFVWYKGENIPWSVPHLDFGQDPKLRGCPLPYEPREVDGPQMLVCILPEYSLKKDDAPIGQQAKPADKPAVADNDNKIADKPQGDCIRVEVCNWPDDKKTSDDKAECKKWKLYKSSEGICYVVPADGSPKSSDDELVTEGEFSQDWVDRIVSQCGKDKDKDDDKPPDSKKADLTSASITGCLPDISANITTSSDFNSALQGFFGWTTGDSQAFNPDGAGWLLSGGSFASGILQGAAIPALMEFGKAAEMIASNAKCEGFEVKQMQIGLMMHNLMGYIAGSAFAENQQKIQYNLNSKCPYLLPTTSEALGQYLADSASIDRLKCLVEANAGVWDQFTPTIDATRSKHSPLDQASLLRREIISRTVFNQRIREQGYIKPEDADEIFKLTEQIPPPQDIIRFMVRDADNQGIVDTFKLDTGFTDNFGGKLQEWAANQGVTEEYMKYLWRAHWDIPSPTQLYEMWRRLRHNAQYNNNGQLEGEIRKALVQQDIAPFWIDRLLALSYSPLTRTDAKRAYEIGSIDKAELWTSFIEGGYSDENANRLVDFTDKQVQLKWYRHPIVKQFAAGFASESELSQTLAFEGATQEHIEMVKQKARVYTRVESRKACTKALRKRYMIGDIDEFEIVPKLTQLGVDGDTAAALSAGWVCERQARGKILPLRTLSSLYREGIIGDDKFIKSLLALQYDADTAMDLLWEQRWKKQEADEAEQKKKDDRLKAEAIKQQKQNEKIAKQNAMVQAGDQKLAAQLEKEKAVKKKAEEIAAAKSKAAAEKGLKVIADRREKLDNLTLDMAVNVTKKTGEYLGDSLRTIKQYVGQTRASGIDPIDFAECGLAASKVFSEGTTSEFLKQWESCWTSPPANP